MSTGDFLTRVIDDGIAAAKADYSEPRQAHKRDGAVAGFEACRDKSPAELGELLTRARRDQMAAFDGPIETYWNRTCFMHEVEWVCNCVSAVLQNEGLPVIITPTARGYMKAASIIGVAQPA